MSFDTNHILLVMLPGLVLSGVCPVRSSCRFLGSTAMVDAGIVTEQEVAGAGNVLNAAFLTYLAAAISSIMTLICYLQRTGVLRMLLSRR